jgi:hypothetical protein
VVAAAPRYDPRLRRALAALDDRTIPIAETCRRLGAVAEALGVPRPSYVHVRRLVHAERRRRAAARFVVDAVLGEDDRQPAVRFEWFPVRSVVVAVGVTASAVRFRRRRAPPLRIARA